MSRWMKSTRKIVCFVCDSKEIGNKLMKNIIWEKYFIAKKAIKNVTL